MAKEQEDQLSEEEMLEKQLVIVVVVTGEAKKGVRRGHERGHTQHKQLPVFLYGIFMSVEFSPELVVKRLVDDLLRQLKPHALTNRMIRESNMMESERGIDFTQTHHGKINHQ